MEIEIQLSEEVELKNMEQTQEEPNTLVSQMNQELAFESGLLLMIGEGYQSLVADVWNQLGVGSEYKDEQLRLFTKDISELIFSHKNRQIQYLNQSRELLVQQEAKASCLRRFLGSGPSISEESSSLSSAPPTQLLPRIMVLKEDVGVLKQQKKR
jgi:hypothetical protein